jgi:hypothetical protein
VACIQPSVLPADQIRLVSANALAQLLDHMIPVQVSHGRLVNKLNVEQVLR